MKEAATISISACDRDRLMEHAKTRFDGWFGDIPYEITEVDVRAEAAADGRILAWEGLVTAESRP